MRLLELPANIFYGTSIPTCIIVMKKCRKEDDNILFIDASKGWEKSKRKQTPEEHIRKIVETYRDRKEIEKIAIALLSKRLPIMTIIFNILAMLTHSRKKSLSTSRP